MVTRCQFRRPAHDGCHRREALVFRPVISAMVCRSSIFQRLNLLVPFLADGRGAPHSIVFFEFFFDLNSALVGHFQVLIKYNPGLRSINDNIDYPAVFVDGNSRHGGINLSEGEDSSLSPSAVHNLLRNQYHLSHQGQALQCLRFTCVFVVIIVYCVCLSPQPANNAASKEVPSNIKIFLAFIFPSCRTII